jgi:uncharacterized protein (TIGR02246 family)
MKRCIVLMLTLACLSLSDVAARPSGDDGPDTLVDRFVHAWNSHDVKAFGPLFTDDAVWVAVAEARTEGRSMIVKEFGDIHATWAKDTTVVASSIEVHSLRNDVAIVLFHAGYLNQAGQRVAGVDRAMIIVALRQKDGWRIAAGQVTKQSSPAQ